MSRVSYNSLNKRWLSGHDTKRNAESLNAMKWLLISLLTFLAVYLVIVTAIGYKGPTPVTTSSTDSASIVTKKSETDKSTPDDVRFKEKSKIYFRVSSAVGLVVVLVTILGVIRESPLMAMLSSTFMLVGVAQSVPSKGDLSRFVLLVFSPMSLMSLIGLLLAVYTALIWSSEFETPPEVIEEYRWYLSPIRGPDVWTGNGNGSNGNNGSSNGKNGNNGLSYTNNNKTASVLDETPVASTSGHRMSAAYSQRDLSCFDAANSSQDQCSRQSLISTSTSTAYYSSCE